MPQKRRRPGQQRVAKNSPEHRHMALAAARLRTEGKTQAQISEFLGRSQADISRLLEFASDLGWYDDHPRLSRDTIPEEDWNTMEQKYFVDYDLGDIFRDWAPAGMKVDIRIFPEKDSAFCIHAASRLLDLIHNCQIFGVMYGYSVHLLKVALEQMRLRLRKINDPDFKVIPLCGDPTHIINVELAEFTASNLAGDFQRILTGKDPTGGHTLNGVPAYTPIRFTLPEENGGSMDLQSFIRSIPGYQLIFGNGTRKNKGLIDQLDGLVTGTGVLRSNINSIENVQSTFIRERLRQEAGRTTVEELRDLIHGDIGGVLIERQGLSTSGQDLVDNLNKCWVGMTQDHLRNIAAKANKTKGMPGVILVAYEAYKAEMIKVLAERGFINHLIINEEVAGALRTLGLKKP